MALRAGGEVKAALADGASVFYRGSLDWRASEMNEQPADDKSKHPKPLAAPEPWNLVAQGYDEVTRPFLAKFSEYALTELSLHSDAAFLDVACGPGTATLLAAPRVGSVVAIDFAEDMLQLCRANVARTGLTNVSVQKGEGQALPLTDDSFDGAVSMFGLMFFPDRKRGMRELVRVLRPGGVAAVSSWAPVIESPAMMALFDAFRAIDPTQPTPQADVASLENPAVFLEEMRDAGFVEVRIESVERTMEFESPEAYWDAMARGAVPLVLLRQKIGFEEFERRAQIARVHLRTSLGSQRQLMSKAFVAFGRKPV